jgi:hypothetical protein
MEEVFGRMQLSVARGKSQARSGHVDLQLFDEMTEKVGDGSA